MVNYHKIYMLGSDVYNLGGPDAFRQFSPKLDMEKNLIILPFQQITELHRIANERYGGGAKDTEDFLQQTIQESNRTQTSEPCTWATEKALGSNHSPMAKVSKIYPLDSGLDLAIIAGTGDYLEQKIIQAINKTFDTRPIIVTLNTLEDIRYSMLDIRVEAPEFLIADKDIINEGIIDGTDRLMAELFQNDGLVPMEQAEELLNPEGRISLFHNQFIKFTGPEGYLYARVTGDVVRTEKNSRIPELRNRRVVLLDQKEYSMEVQLGSDRFDNILGVTPENMEQYIALKYGLLNEDVSLMFLCGGAGSGKTLLSYIAGVFQTMTLSSNGNIRRKSPSPDSKYRDQVYKQMMLLKSIDLLGGSRRDVGYLPGDLYQKMKVHFEPFINAHDLSSLALFSFDQMIRHPKYENDYGPIRDNLKDIEVGSYSGYLTEDRPMVKVMDTGHLNGASVGSTYILIDEAQNLTPWEIKQLLSRVDKKSKVVVSGDPKQISNPYCSQDLNGLTYAAKHYLERAKDSIQPRNYIALLSLTQNHRDIISEDSLSMRVYNT
jgi:predicted ribonuclease YlaK